MAQGHAARRGSHQRLLGLACGLLGLLLAGQGVWQERDRLAVAFPALEPVLARACEAMACTLAPPRAIESIAIDSSSFTSVRPGVYLLHVTLKNAATSLLATPALELTLTDRQDRPLLRRVLLPTELAPKPAMAAGAELVASLPLQIGAGVTPERITGYKLLVFYP